MFKATLHAIWEHGLKKEHSGIPQILLKYFSIFKSGPEGHQGLRNGITKREGKRCELHPPPDAMVLVVVLSIDDLQNYCLGTRRGIAADRGRPAVGFVYISNGKLVHFIFSLWPFSSQNHAPKGPKRKRNKPRCCWPAIFASLLFSENEKGQRVHGLRRAIVHAHCTCHE